MADEPDLKLAGLSLWVLSREFPSAIDVWDGNWLNAVARVEAPGAFVEAKGPWLRTDDLESFWPQLDAMHQNLRGEALLETLDPALRIEMSCNLRGQVGAIISITPNHLFQKHEFKFDIDQSHLPHVSIACRRILERFPSRRAQGAD